MISLPGSAFQIDLGISDEMLSWFQGFGLVGLYLNLPAGFVKDVVGYW